MSFEYEILAKNDRYCTEKVKKRTFLPVSFSVYLDVLRIVVRSYRQVRKGTYDSENWTRASLQTIRALEKVGGKVIVDGLYNLKKIEGPVVFVGNHMSSLETMILPCLIEPIKKVTFVIKKELTDYPMFGDVVRSSGAVVGGRRNPREARKCALEAGKRTLQGGKSIIIFPPTTRTQSFVPGEFNTLGVKLAKSAGVPVIPFALISDAWGNGKKIKELGKIDPSKTAYFRFFEPIHIEGNGATQNNKIIEDICSAIEEWGREELIIN